MSFKAVFICPVDASELCDFVIHMDAGVRAFKLEPGEEHQEAVDEGATYVGVIDGTADGLESQGRPVSGGRNVAFL